MATTAKPTTAEVVVAVFAFAPDLGTKGAIRAGAGPAGTSPAPTVVGAPRPALTPRQIAELEAFLDPDRQLWEQASVFVEVNGERLELPWRAEDEVFELLELLYQLDGSRRLDGVEFQVGQAFLFALTGELGTPFRWGLQTGLDQMAELNRLSGLAAARGLSEMAKSVGSMSSLIPFFQRGPEPYFLTSGQPLLTPSPFSGSASTSLDSAGKLPASLRLLSAAWSALSKAREELEAYIVAELARVEREAQRVLLTTLRDSEAKLYRETMRYFSWSDDRGAKEALKWLKAPQAKGKPKNGKAPKGPPVTHVDDLRAAMKELVPGAQAMLKAKKEFDDNERQRKWGNPTFPSSPVQPPEPLARTLAERRSELAREVGRRSELFPILLRLEAKDIVDADGASDQLLGPILFSPLKTCYAANRALQARVHGWGLDAAAVAGMVAPDRQLAARVSGGKADASVWLYRTYMERALDRLTLDEDSLLSKATREVLAMITPERDAGVASFAQAAGETMAMGATAAFVPRLLGPLNLVVAGWHIAQAVGEFNRESDDYWCVLDPRDALVESDPSAVGLAFDIATEAAFAFI